MFTIDTNIDVTNHLGAISAAGIKSIGRYYSHSSSKRLTKREAAAITAAGLTMFVVFEDGAHPVLTRDAGARDAQAALAQAAAVGQPQGSAIYFALDSDLGSSQLPGVRAYFSGVRDTVGGTYELGVYGDGTVCQILLDEGVCRFAWLSASRGFSGSKAFYKGRRWAIAQDPKINQPRFGIHVDFNEVNGDFGDFDLGASSEMAQSAVAASSMPWMDWMRMHRNEVQRTGAKPTKFTEAIFKHTTYPPLNGVTPESCAATVCAALEETGYLSTHSAAAASYIAYGTPCELKPGCICVFQWPGGQHHVDFCDEIIDAETVRGLGGNQGHLLQDSDFLTKYIVATRWPVASTRPFSATVSSPPEAAAVPAPAGLFAQLLSDHMEAKAELSERYLLSKEAREFTAQAATASPIPEINVVGVGLGEKISDGVPTGTMSVKLFVRVKYPWNNISEDQRLPSSIAGMPTDVEEVGVFRPLAAMPDPRVQYTPAQPGCSIGFEFPAAEGTMMAGTFGGVVADTDGNLYVLSNNHVLAHEGRLALGSPIFQAGLLDLEPGAEKRQIATLTAFKPYDTAPLKVDAAIARALAPDSLSREILFIGAPKGTGRAQIDMVVHKFGRTTSYTVGRVTSIATDATVTYETGDFTFLNQMIIQGSGGSAFSRAGDSGSLILDRRTNTAVGLLFAGSSSHTLANHLDEVLQAFNVKLE